MLSGYVFKILFQQLCHKQKEDPLLLKHFFYRFAISRIIRKDFAQNLKKTGPIYECLQSAIGPRGRSLWNTAFHPAVKLCEISIMSTLGKKYTESSHAFRTVTKLEALADHPPKKSGKQLCCFVVFL